MPAYRDTLDDMIRKFNRTYILYNKKLAYVQGFDLTADGNIMMNITEQSGMKPRWIQDFNAEQIEVISPDSMYVNNIDPEAKSPKKNEGAYTFWRNPRRQWRRSLCEETCVITNPLIPLYKTFGKNWFVREIGLGFSVVEHLLNPKYPSIIDAMSWLRKYPSVAISPNFALTLSPIDYSPLLANMFGFIGKVSWDRLQVYYPPVLQEIQDFINRTRQPFKAELCQMKK